MFINILKYGFLIIFLATALIGILSLPGWIKIDEWYRKKIFIALILEVVGAIIILFNQELVGVSKLNPDITISENNWIALNDSGLIVQPEVNFKVQDTSIIKTFGKQSYVEFRGLTGKIVDNGLSIRNSANESLGTIKASDLKQSGIFNSFKTAKDEITSTENYSYIKWNKQSNGRWGKKGSFIGPFELEVDDYYGGTYYQIKNNESNTIVFDSRDNSKDLISVDNRIIHFFEYENVYYLLRIAWADLEKNEKYVHVVNVRMKPIFKKD